MVTAVATSVALAWYTRWLVAMFLPKPQTLYQLSGILASGAHIPDLDFAANSF